MSQPDTLTLRQLNRATLARQGLLERRTWSALDTIHHLVGMQAQEPLDPYLALWSRIEEFDPLELEGLLLERRAVRTPLMRGTVHLVTADDAATLRPLMQPVLTRAQRGAFGKRLTPEETDELAEAGRMILAEEPMTFAALRKALGERWAAYDPMAVGYSVSYRVPLVQVPPRGTWSGRGQAIWTTTESWLGRPLGPVAPIEQVIVRYLAAFGPASVADAQAWCGLTRFREVFEALRPSLVTFRDETGRELFDLPDAPRPAEDTPAPPRFLPYYDNVFLGHKDRRRIVSDEFRTGVNNPAGMVRTVLVDGFIAGTWAITKTDGTATLQLSPSVPWSKADRIAVEAEAYRLLAVMEPAASAHEVTISSLA